MKTINPKTILEHIENGEKTFDELLELLGDPNHEWMYFHIRMWQKKGKLQVIIKKKVDEK